MSIAKMETYRQIIQAELPAIAAYATAIDPRFTAEHVYIDYDETLGRFFPAVTHPDLPYTAHQFLNSKLWQHFRLPE